jgi:AraC family transcriptional regulator
MSPHKYVVSRRIAHAKQLLRDGRLDVGDAAFASGFANQSHFTKVFRRRTGMTPREFRSSV